MCSFVMCFSLAGWVILKGVSGDAAVADANKRQTLSSVAMTRMITFIRHEAETKKDKHCGSNPTRPDQDLSDPDERYRGQRFESWPVQS